MQTKPKTVFLVLAALLPVFLITSCGRKCDRCGHADIYSSGYATTGDVVVIPADAAPIVVTPPVVQEVKPVEIKPVEPPPVVKTPIDAKVTEVKPVEPVKPVEIKKVEPKVEVKPASLERKIVRIRAGSVAEWKDKQGNVWLADSGFADGAMVDRGKVTIDKSDDDELYSTERCCMDKFSWPVANGKYLVKLHFAETFEDVKKAGERLFNMDVMGEKIKDFDIFKEAGGANKALVKTFKVNVTNGKIEINFSKSDQKEPAINGIEILPE